MNGYTSQDRIQCLKWGTDVLVKFQNFKKGSMSCAEMDVRKLNHLFIGASSSLTKISPDHFMTETETFIYHLFIEK